jgi:hypothetical protein
MASGAPPLLVAVHVSLIFDGGSTLSETAAEKDAAAWASQDSAVRVGAGGDSARLGACVSAAGQTKGGSGPWDAVMTGRRQGLGERARQTWLAVRAAPPGALAPSISLCGSQHAVASGMDALPPSQTEQDSARGLSAVGVIVHKWARKKASTGRAQVKTKKIKGKQEQGS